MKNDTSLENLIKMGYESNGAVIDCTPLQSGTCVTIQKKDVSLGMRLADYIEKISREIPEKVIFHGNKKQTLEALQMDMQVYRAKRSRRAAMVNFGFFTAFAALAYHFQNILCYASISFFSIFPLLYAIMDSKEEILTKYYILQQ